VHEFLFDLLGSKDVAPGLVLETLCSVRNLIANCDDNKKIILNHSRSIQVKENGFLDTLKRILRAHILREDIFLAVVEVLKLLTTAGESRNGIFKVRLCFLMIRSHSVKNCLMY
jgi:hypothetical protein